MMTAKRESDGLLVIGERIEKDAKAKYLCPCCEQQVIHNKPTVRKRIGHFSHKNVKNNECPNRINESPLHLKLKLDLYDYLVKENKGGITQLEAWIAKKRRPDILLKTENGEYFAFEIQCSKIGLDELVARNEYYSKHKIHVLWMVPFSTSRFFTTNEKATHHPIWENWESGKEWWGREETFKSHERYLYHLYGEKLFCYTTNKKISPGGICWLKLEDSFTTDSYFDEYGDEQYVKPKRKKTKMIVSQFCDSNWHCLKPITTKSNFVGNEGYSIPSTKILLDSDN